MAAPQQEAPPQITYELHTTKIKRIIDAPNRIQLTRESEPKLVEEYQQLVSASVHSPGRLAALVKAFCKFGTEKLENGVNRDYTILHEICLIAISRQMDRLPMGGAVEGQPRIELTTDDIILLSSQRKPIPHTAIVLFQLIQQSITSITAFKKDSWEVVTVSMAAYARHLIRACREPSNAKASNYTYFDQLPADQKLSTYSALVEFVQYSPVPVKEAKLSITCCLDDLAEWAKRQERYKSVKPSDAEIAENTWRFSRPMRGLLWMTITQLMGYPPQEGEEALPGGEDEKNRPTQVEDPETGYWVNHGDAYLKAAELGLPENEVEDAKEQAGLHPLEFSALGFPQLHPPLLKNLSPVSTVLAVGAIVAGIIGLRMWAFGGKK
jgi:hypothetical protein